jgi:Flp pilus assembly pilin Flp
MNLNLRNFLRDDAGAITIDWVALTAGLLLLGIMVVYSIFNGGVSGLVDKISATLASITTDVDTGDAPGLNGSDVVVAVDTMSLSNGMTLPIGTVIDVQAADRTVITTPDGKVTIDSGPPLLPGPGTMTVTSANTLTLTTGSGSYEIGVDSGGNLVF